MSMRIRVAVVDGHAMFVTGLLRILKRAGGIDIAGIGRTVDDAIRIARETRPDVLLLATSTLGWLPAALDEISASAPAVRIVVLTSEHEPQEGYGKHATADKGVTGPELLRIIALAVNDEPPLPGRKKNRLPRPRATPVQ